jgi:hypothetical protein
LAIADGMPPLDIVLVRDGGFDSAAWTFLRMLRDFERAHPERATLPVVMLDCATPHVEVDAVISVGTAPADIVSTLSRTLHQPRARVAA